MAGTVQYVDSVGQESCNRVERFNGSAGASGQIYDDRPAANRGYCTRKNRARGFLQAFGAHLLGKSRYQSLCDGNGGLGGHIAGTDPGSTGGQYQIRLIRIRGLFQKC